MFGHLGVEWNLLEAPDDQRADLGDAISFHKSMRPLLHGGQTRRFDHPEPAVVAHGVIAADRRSALVSIALVSTAPWLILDRLRIDGLDPAQVYRVELAPLAVMADMELGPAAEQPAWLRHGLVTTGANLAVIGLQPPVMNPESAVIVQITAIA